MPKRDAGNELNHDNWEDEEEPEEAGEFKKASEEALKGRVFKKGKRRNLTEDQKKNIFAGFGGFTSSNKSAEEAFSFLGNPKPEEKKDDDAAKSKESNGDGKKEEEKEEKSNGGSKPDDLMAKFMAKKSGSWSCDVCMISNDADKVKCVACETPKPGGAAAVSGSPKKFESQMPSSDPLMAKFLTKGANSSKWSCEVCMISNPSDKVKCVACETPNPKVSASAPTVSTKNDEETKPTFNFGGGGGGFKFVDAAASKTDSPLSSFKFGSAAPQPAEASVTGGGFKFGSADEASAAPPTGGFKFGVSDAQAHTSTAEQVAGFKFGNSSEAASSTPAQVTGFKFGAGTETSSNAATTGFFSAKPVSGNVSSPFQGPTGFLFSSTEKVSATPKKADAPTKAKRKEYLASLKALNTQVTNWIKSHVDENPLVDLSPVFKDYGKHLQQLRTKFDIKSIEMGESAEKKPEDSASAAEEGKDGGQKKESTVTMFPNVTAAASKDVEKKEPFSFGVSQSGFGNLSSGFGSGAGFSFGSLNSKKDSEPENGEAEVDKDGDEEEEAVKVDEKSETVVEEDAFFSKKCKLFYKKEDSYTERGLGTIHLKLTDEKKVQVVVRAGTSLGNILLNVLISEGIPVERVGKNNVMVICLPNPPIDLKADPQPTTFLIRVKTGEEADELKEKMLSLDAAETSV